MKKILVADISEYRKEIAEIYRGLDYEITFCDSAFDAISKLKAFDFDLVISEVELPGDNAFDLYEYIRENYPYIPVIMMTGRNIDTFFSRIITRGIGNVLHKPVKKPELLKLTEKLITLENIFGLENYIQDIIDHKKIRITKSEHIRKAISLIIEQIENWNFNLTSKSTLNLMLNEMTINAVYHSHGLTKEKLHRTPVVLGEGKYVDIHFCRNRESYAISITDYNGKLTKEKILESINAVIIQNELIEKSFETGEDIADHISETGRGIDLVRKLSGEYYFIMKMNFRTEIILIFKQSDQSYTPDQSSLKIIYDRRDS
ncbi:MAG TPA: response regulator [Spirochaetota bacterium]|nr:response regulator [Spirochaetota bacterium]HPF05474.1 response regulator [Spirochaetota bacterium]HPJ42977.1 response regulator [Spirochaetota bacterium]HPR37290.1 response regulator [Spirochaetota bacterium]